MKEGTIIKRFDVSMMYHKGFKRDINDISEAVIHATHGKSANGLLSWMIGGERAAQYKKGIALFHFLIGRLGEVYQIAPVARWYYHSSSGKHDKQTIGIELLNSLPNNEGDFTERQYVALEDLLFNVLFPNCKKIRRIVSHDYNYNTYSNNRKGCPGKNFSWTQMRDMFKIKKIDILPMTFEDVIEFEPLTIKGA